MGLKDLILLKQIKFGVYSFTLLLVLVMGLALWFSMDLSAPLIQSRPIADISTSSRSPSSFVVGTGLPEPIADGAPIMIEIDCADASQRPPVTVRSAHLRIKAKGCNAKAIINGTNGFEATLFQLGERDFTSDYISLSPGENQLSLVQETETGLPSTINLLVLSQ